MDLRATERQGVLAMSSEINPPGERRILRRAEVEARSGFKRAHIYTLMKQGDFPRAIRLGKRAVGWDSVEIDQWIAERAKART
jgi:prophage regulatory protein